MAAESQPQQLGARYTPAASPDFSPDALLDSAIAENRLLAAARSAAPTLPEYAGLREELARYRNLARHSAWQKNLPPLPAGKLQPRPEIQRHRAARRAAAAAWRPARRQRAAPPLSGTAGRRRQVIPGEARADAGWRHRQDHLRPAQCVAGQPRAADRTDPRTLALDALAADAAGHRREPSRVHAARLRAARGQDRNRRRHEGHRRHRQQAPDTAL
jgi:hypothetical protein